MLPPQIDIVSAEPGSAPHREMIALRHRILRAPLGLTFTEEQLAAEKDQVHLALRHDDVVVGALLLVPPDTGGIAKLRQMAIEPSFERRGFGKRLLHHGEDLLLQLRATRITLAAREHAIHFYEKLGYVAQGEFFTEVTLPHRLMVKRLTDQAGGGPARV